MTVYAVPQVLAATARVALASVHVGTLLKLVRVLVLGPTVLILSRVAREEGACRPSLAHMMPWFIVGFVLLLLLRSFNMLPTVLIAPAQASASVLTIMSMATLGLGVDVRSVLRAGKQVTSVVVLFLLVLAAIRYGLI